MFHQNLMIQIREILEDVNFGPDYHNCPIHFSPFLENQIFSEHSVFARMITPPLPNCNVLNAQTQLNSTQLNKS